MMDKLRQRQEITAYRIVRRHVLKIVNSIPMNNMSRYSYEAVIRSNINVKNIKDIFVDLYLTVGKPQFKRSKKNELSFEDIISLWLGENAGLRILSVHKTLIEAIVGVIADGYENNISVQEIARNLQNKFGWYREQALRIARTETTTATNYATVVASQNSDFVLVKQWISVQDGRTRRPPNSKFDHLDMNGVIVGENDSFLVGGEVMNFPGDPKASAGNTINCRCKIVFTVKQDEDGLPIRKLKT